MTDFVSFLENFRNGLGNLGPRTTSSALEPSGTFWKHPEYSCDIIMMS
jgi:hypothetical protein